MTEICFILGIMPRSGTNYIENLTILHEQCIATGPVWEDFLLSTTPSLEKSKKKLNSRWDSYWFRNTETNFIKKLGIDIGNGMKSFLLDQAKGSNAEYLISKTPTVYGLENFCSYFPGTKLIIIIRDGRDVAESGTKSFQWDFIKALLDWKLNARKIKKFLIENKGCALLIRFEDLFTSPEQTMKTVIEYLNLDAASYPFEELNNMPVSGSSTLKSEKGKIDWKATEKKTDFQPVSRFSTWSPSKKFLSLIIARKELESFGYTTNFYTTLPQKIQAYLCLIFWPLTMIPRTLYYLVKEKTFILKTH